MTTEVRLQLGVEWVWLEVGVANLCKVAIIIDVQQLQSLFEFHISSRQQVVEDMVVPLPRSLAHNPALLQQVLLNGGTANSTGVAIVIGGTMLLIQN